MKNCKNFNMNECKNDKKCDFFDNICTPSLIAMADLSNKDDCIEIVEIIAIIKIKYQ